MRQWGLKSWAVLLLWPALACAESGTVPDDATLLRQLGDAGRQLSYSGVFVFQHDGQMRASKLFHSFESGSEKTKIEALDGPQREIICADNDVSFYFPESHSIRQAHGLQRHFFPELITPPYDTYQDNYTLSITGQDRVAGHDCQLVSFFPRDNLRYAHQFCADKTTGLMLRAVTLGLHGDPIDMTVFTEVSIGKPIAPKIFKPRFADILKWRVENMLGSGEQAEANGWEVNNPPRGFRKIAAISRHRQGKGRMTQLVYSDGLAFVSVFIEPADGSAGSVQLDAVPASLSLYSGQSADQRVTVVGEVPMATVTQIGQSVVNPRSGRP